MGRCERSANTSLGYSPSRRPGRIEVEYPAQPTEESGLRKVLKVWQRLSTVEWSLFIRQDYHDELSAVGMARKYEAITKKGTACHRSLLVNNNFTLKFYTAKNGVTIARTCS